MHYLRLLSNHLPHWRCGLRLRLPPPMCLIETSDARFSVAFEVLIGCSRVPAAVPAVGFLSKCLPCGSRLDWLERGVCTQIRIRSALAVAVNRDGGAHDSDHRGAPPQADTPRWPSVPLNARSPRSPFGLPPVRSRSSSRGLSPSRNGRGPSSQLAASVISWPSARRFRRARPRRAAAWRLSVRVLSYRALRQERSQDALSLAVAALRSGALRCCRGRRPQRDLRLFASAHASAGPSPLGVPAAPALAGLSPRSSSKNSSLLRSGLLEAFEPSPPSSPSS